MLRAVLIIGVVLFSAREAEATQVRLLDLGLRSPLGAFRVDTNPTIATPAPRTAAPDTLRLLPVSLLEGAASLGVSGLITLSLFIPSLLGADHTSGGILLYYGLPLLAAITTPFLTSLIVWAIEKAWGAGTPSYWWIFLASVGARILVAFIPIVGFFLGPIAGPVAEVLVARMTAVPVSGPPALTEATKRETVAVLTLAF